MTITDFFKKLGAPLKDFRRSWGSVSESGDVFLRIWGDQITKNDDGVSIVRITNHKKRTAQAEEGITKYGWTERLHHIELIKEGATTYLIKCKAKDKNTENREIDGFEKRHCFLGGYLVERDGDYWLEIGAIKPIREIVNETGERKIKKKVCLIRDNSKGSEPSEDPPPQDKMPEESEITDSPKLDEPLQDVGVFVAKGVDPEKPGIYVFVIEGQGIYVGKYTLPYRYKSEYANNVKKLLSGKSYRPKNPDGFRKIHRALAKAVGTEKQKISLILIENWDGNGGDGDGESGLRRERELINMIGTLND